MTFGRPGRQSRALSAIASALPLLSIRLSAYLFVLAFCSTILVLPLPSPCLLAVPSFHLPVYCIASGEPTLRVIFDYAFFLGRVRIKQLFSETHAIASALISACSPLNRDFRRLRRVKFRFWSHR